MGHRHQGLVWLAQDQQGPHRMDRRHPHRMGQRHQVLDSLVQDQQGLRRMGRHHRVPDRLELDQLVPDRLELDQLELDQLELDRLELDPSALNLQDPLLRAEHPMAWMVPLNPWALNFR